MLFVLNDQGVPSVAKFIRLKLGRARRTARPARRSPRSTPLPPRRRSPPALRRPRPRRRPRSSSRSSEAELELRVPRRHRRLGELRFAPATLTGLSAGPHTFAARATDPAGNTDPDSGDLGLDGCAGELRATVAPETPSSPVRRCRRPPRQPRSTSLSERSGLDLRVPARRRQLDAGCASPTDHFGLATGSTCVPRPCHRCRQATPTRARPRGTGRSRPAPRLRPPAPASPPADGGTHRRRRWTGWPTRRSDSTPPTLSVLGKAVKKRRVLLELAVRRRRARRRPRGGSSSPEQLVPSGSRRLRLRSRRDTAPRLKLQLSKKAWRVARRALSARKTVRVRVQLTARDSAGNVTAAQRSIRLKR